MKGFWKRLKRRILTAWIMWKMRNHEDCCCCGQWPIGCNSGPCRSQKEYFLEKELEKYKC